MSVRLIIAPPAGGKTTACIGEVRKHCHPGSPTNIRVLVPEKSQIIHWKKQLAHSGGCIGVRVQTPEQLAEEILEHSGAHIERIPAQLKSVLLRDVIRKTELEYFEPIKNTPGFTDVMSRTITELIHAARTPGSFFSQCSTPDERDAARIYEAFLQKLSEKKRITDAQLLSHACGLMNEAAILFRACPLIVADGFDDFTVDQCDFLYALTAFVPDMLITLPGEHTPDGKRFMYGGFRRSEQKIRSYFPDMTVERLPYSGLTSSVQGQLRHLEETIMESGNQRWTGENDSLIMLEASSQPEEAREVLRRIKMRIVRDHIDPGICAVYIPQADTYMPLLRSIGNEMGIPLYFAHHRPLDETPAASALQTLLRFPCGSFGIPAFYTPALFALLRSPFFDFGITAPEITWLEMIAMKYSIIAGWEQWEEAFDHLIGKSALLIPKDEDREVSLKGYPPQTVLKMLKDKVGSLFSKFPLPDGEKSRAEWSAAVKSLYEQFHWMEGDFDIEEKAVQEGITSVCADLNRFEKILARDPLTYDEYIEEIMTALHGRSLELTDFPQGMVYVGDIKWARGIRYDTVALMGFSEKLFPGTVPDELILTDKLREELLIPDEKEQSALLLQALTRANNKLIISRPAKTDKGEEWKASFFWDSILPLLPEDVQPERVETLKALDYANAASEAELIFRAALRGEEKLPEADDDSTAKFERVRSSAMLAELQKKGLYSENDGCIDILPLRLSPDQPYSPSDVEAFSACPLYYLVNRVMKLEPTGTPEEGMDAAQRGSLLHAILAEVFSPGSDTKYSEDLRRRAETVCNELLGSAPLRYGFRPSNIWDFEKEEIRQVIMDTIEKMSEAFSNGERTVIGTERSFGVSSPPLEVPLEEHDLYFRGFIDRVDRDSSGLLHVIDYKTGSSMLNKQDLRSGVRIQSGLYAAAAVNALQLGERAESGYWCINAGEYKAGNPYIKGGSIFGTEFIQAFSDGIQSGSYPAFPYKGKCKSYCPASQWCRCYEAEAFHGK